MVNHALLYNSTSSVRKVVTKFGTVFKRADELLSDYAFCVANGVKSANVKCPAAGIPTDEVVASHA